ncbi:MAG TPA: DUF3501 family protein [Candidatus Kapabacteria bacterium]|nr:DUF3501 family protein [Candidatus Kapabacteria bacterium]
MEKLKLNDIKNFFEYEKTRPNFRAKIIALKKDRRVPVGGKITFVFENRDTMLFQIQEMARIERITDDTLLQHELDTYNQLIPNGDELSATLMVDINDKDELKSTLDALTGMHREVYLEIGNEKIAAEFDETQFTDERISAVQYIKFPLSQEQKKNFRDNSIPVRLSITHLSYAHAVEIPQNVRQSLIEDLSN